MSGCDSPTAPPPTATTTVTVTQQLSLPKTTPPVYLNVRDFGARGDWKTDDTTAIQRALDAVPAAGGVVFFPTGGYFVPNGGLVCNRSVTLLGVEGLDGTGSRIHVSADNVVGVTLNGQASVLDSIEITRENPTPSAGLVGAVLNSDFAEVRSSRIAGFHTNLRISGTYYTVQSSSFRNFSDAGIELNNVVAGGDAGDGTITTSTFERAAQAPVGGSGVRWLAGGGLRFVNNKINGETTLQNGLLLTPARSVKTGVFVVSDNSIENFVGAGVNITPGPGVIENSIVVSGNQFAGYNTGRQSVAITIDQPTHAVSITGNTIFTVDYGIVLQSVQGATVAGNALSEIVLDGITVGDRARDVVVDEQAIGVLQGQGVVRR